MVTMSQIVPFHSATLPFFQRVAIYPKIYSLNDCIKAISCFGNVLKQNFGPYISLSKTVTMSRFIVTLWQWTWGGIGRKVGMLNIVSLGLHLYINWYFVNYKYTSTEKLKKKTQIHTRHNVTKIMSQCHTENDVAPLN